MTGIKDPKCIWTPEVLEKVGIELIKQMIYSDFLYMFIVFRVRFRIRVNISYIWDVGEHWDEKLFRDRIIGCCCGPFVRRARAAVNW